MGAIKQVFIALLAALGLNAAAAELPTANQAAAMAQLRAVRLASKPADLGLGAAAFADKPWGVLMEMGLKNGVAASLVVLADGTTEMYFSHGMGIFDTGENARVRKASDEMLELSRRHQADMEVASATPLPLLGKVHFYVLAPQGTLAHAAAKEALDRNEDALADLFRAGMAVIAAMQASPQK